MSFEKSTETYCFGAFSFLLLMGEKVLTAILTATEILKFRGTRMFFNLHKKVSWKNRFFMV